MQEDEIAGASIMHQNVLVNMLVLKDMLFSVKDLESLLQSEKKLSFSNYIVPYIVVPRKTEKHALCNKLFIIERLIGYFKLFRLTDKVAVLLDH